LPVEVHETVFTWVLAPVGLEDLAYASDEGRGGGSSGSTTTSAGSICQVNHSSNSARKISRDHLRGSPHRAE
jgi:hypothetical protein